MKQFCILAIALLFSLSSFAVVDPIVGPTSVCAGGTVTLTDATPGGTWTSSNTAIATINSATGSVSGVGAGTVTITYIVGIEYATATIIVNALPPASAVTGGGSYCAGGSGVNIGCNISYVGIEYQLRHAGINIGVPLPGTGSAITFGLLTSTGNYTVMAYSPLTGCSSTMTGSVNVSVNSLPTAYTLSAGGGGCTGSSITLSGSDIGATYHLYRGAALVGMPMTGLGTVLNFGPQTAGIYTAVGTNTTTGCTRSMLGSTTLNPTPAISGPSAVCVGSDITLTGTGTWSSSNPAICTVNPTSGVVTGMSLGVATITTSGGCVAIKTVTVSTTPTAIAGPSSLCTGSTILLNNAVAGGVWTSSNVAIATVGSASGMVTSVSAGTATITYSLGTGCNVTKVVTANSLPLPITGTGLVCTGHTTTLTCASTGGIWSSSSASFTIGSSTGIVTGVATGTGMVTYTMGTGCNSARVITVNPLPIIIGSPSVCVGNSIHMFGSPSGGIWSCTPVATATINPSAGIIFGASSGTAYISYTLSSTGCQRTQTVNVIPATCTGTPSGGTTTPNASTICYDDTMTLSLSGATLGCAITYQWQNSTDGTTFADIAGATSTSYSSRLTNPQYFRCKVTCPTTSLYDYSTTQFVNVRATIASHSVITPDAACTNPDFYISACGFSPSFNVTTWFGDGTSVNTPLTASWIYDAHVPHSYSAPGTYNIKQVLYMGTVPQDSITFSHEHRHCRTLPVKFYVDANNNCTFDAGDKQMTMAVKVVIDSNGVPVDTISTTSGFYYKAFGPAGTIYTYRIESHPAGMTPTCPVGGTLSETILATVNIYDTKYIGFGCASGTGSSFDLVQHTSLKVGRHAQQGTITVSNTFCTAQDAVVTLHHDRRYRYYSHYPTRPTPISYTDSTITWLLANISSGGTATAVINYWLETPSGFSFWLIPGETVRSTYVTLAPAGEIDTNNNVRTRKDTVKSSWDPNDIAVSPEGYVLPCTKLQYTIRFENTGNDTAHNIHVMDTLSNDLDINTLEIEVATAAMNIALIKDGPYQIAKFDFPGIKLLDSSHHGQCQGMIIYNIKTKPGIADGTIIPNTAAIYFDDNEPVITNTAQNVTGIAPITGPDNLCLSSTTWLDNGTTGGIWSSANTGIATIGSSTGMVTGSTAGTVAISYTAGNECGSRSATTTISVNTTPAPITGTAGVCLGVDAPFGSTTTGGTWSISNPTAATINASTGLVSGLTADTATITYTLTGSCQTTRVITINTSPAIITGTDALCNGTTTTLSDVTPSGTWSSSNTTVATVNSSGMITTGSAGVAAIAYTLANGCSAAHTITVFATPAAISGTPILCSGTSTTLTDATAAGTWSSSNTSVATINASSGLVNGIAGGITTITYAITAGATTCATTRIITVNPSPSPVLGTASLCSGTTATLTNGTGAGTWASSNPAVANIGAATGVVIGGSAGVSVISYTLSTGCNATRAIIVHPTPAPISGSSAICNGTTTTLTSTTPSGTWSAGSSVATIDASGVLTAASVGTVNITYALGTSCSVSKTITINPLPASITGTDALCSGAYAIYTNGTPAGTWSAGGSPLVSIGATTGYVTGIAAGVASITYTLGTGCKVVKPVTVNATPAPITGAGPLCSGNTATLSDATTGGAWHSSSTSVATINATSGLLTGITGGVTTITYLMSTGCSSTAIVTIHPTPTPIAGAGSVCEGTTTTLTDAVPGGTWSGSSSVASVGAASGIVTGIAPGTVSITYATGLGCTVTKLLTVNPQPSVFSTTGGGAYCSGDAGALIGLSNSAAGVNYFVYRGSTATGPFAGTGTALSFGYHTIAGTYTISAVNTTTACQKNMPDSAVVTITPSVTPSVSMLTVPGIDICEGIPVNFSSTSINGGAIPAYQWIINGLPVATSSTYTFYPANGDVVKVKLTSNATCARPDTAIATVAMTVHKNGPLTVSVNASPGLYVAVGETVTFTANVPAGSTAISYQWLINGIPVPGATNSTYITNVLFHGDIVTCEVDDNGPCTTDGSSSVTVTLNTVGITPIPGNGLVNIYPNPNKGSFSIKGFLPGIDNEEVAIRVTDVLGRVVHQENIVAVNGNIDAAITMGNTIAGGVYVLSLQSGQQKTNTHFIVEK